ncbi:nuclear transport factor 2 family protein [Arachidicoccus ginsenosidivorans]|jgi:hypothetical protein|uniref:Nuclear transport factor 2 family protein n=1 Tax=Arachidicoccus ginsenosidivorans TaxID=496057 RepID=A0A5B8VG74_9BACT|nr:nuclear transport factor 2 family protein [Arachidicoccus ginsenosidivorans]QEC70597.1 nuclear transport factor 2 family protein [Arachidicoccus ginsenosidivorans]
MKHLFLSTFLLCMIAVTAFGQRRATESVKQAITKLNQAMVDADSTTLYKMTFPTLSYGHSSGVIQNQQQFVEGITSGRSDFISIDLSDESINVVGNTATVRHILSAKTFDNKVPGTVRLEILLVWVKSHGSWKLLARQAVKPAN